MIFVSPFRPLLLPEKGGRKRNHCVGPWLCTLVKKSFSPCLSLAFTIYCGTEKSREYLFLLSSKHLLHWLSQWVKILNHWNILLIKIYFSWKIVCQTYGKSSPWNSFFHLRTFSISRVCKSKTSFLFQPSGSAFPDGQTLYRSCGHVRNPWGMITIIFPSGKEWTSTTSDLRMEGN